MLKSRTARRVACCVVLFLPSGCGDNAQAESKMVNAVVQAVDAKKGSLTVKDRRGGQEIVVTVLESTKIRSRKGPIKLAEVSKDQVVIVVYDPDTLRATGIQIVGQPSAPPGKSTAKRPEKSASAGRTAKPKPAVARTDRARKRDGDAPIRTDLPVGLAVGNLVPEIAGADLAGQRFKLSDYRGRVIVLDFWGDW